jgi:hypothetical protein
MSVVKKCDYNNQITSFPLVLSGTPSVQLYDSVNESITIDFHWAPRSTPPSFNTGTNILDEGVYLGPGSSTISTMRFNNIRYTLHSVQICNSTHTSWIVPTANKSNNTMDLIILFSNLSATTQYVVVVLPILNNGAISTDPAYLTTLANRASGTVSLSSCMTQSGNSPVFACYSTCVDGYTEHQNTQQVYTFVAVEGISVSVTTLETIRSRLPAGSPARSLPPVQLPFLLHYAKEKSLITIAEFTKYVITTKQLVNLAGARNMLNDLSVSLREDPTDAYKCVPLNPAKDIVDGKLKVDTNSGELLSKILAERDAVISSSGIVPQDPLTGAKFSNLISIILAGIFGVLVLCACLYYVVNWNNSSSTDTTGEMRVDSSTGISTIMNSWFTQVPMYIVMVLGAGLVGFIVGITTYNTL